MIHPHRHTRSVMRRVLKVLFTFTLMLCFLVPISTPASAHAELSTLTPANGSSLAKSPRSISVTFNEAVTVERSSVELLDQKGKVLARNGSAQSSTTITVPTRVLPRGHYVVRWVVSSADGHPVVGASAFSVSSVTSKARTAKVVFSGNDGTTAGAIDGARIGRRTITLAGVTGEGTLELRHPAFKAPIIWNLQTAGTELIASGVIPSPGTWQITMKVRTGPFDQLTRTVSLKIAA